MTWTGRYSPEPLNDSSSLDARIRAEATNLIQSQSVLGSVVPRSIPADAIVRPFVTELPISAQDGDEIRFLADSANGVVWHLRYRAGAPSDYRWEFIGGPPLYAEVTTSQSRASTSYGDLGTVGPSITLPAAGDYDVKIGARMWSGTNGESPIMSYAIGSTAAADADWLVGTEPAGDNTTAEHLSRERRKTGLGAVTLTAKYRSFGGASSSFEDRTMIVTPVRLGRT